MAEPSETSPLIPSGEQHGAVPRRYSTSSAPADFIVSPGGSQYEEAIQRRHRALRRARGSGRGVQIPGVRTCNIIAHAGATPNRGDEHDPISSVRVEEPYRQLQEENPGYDITRVALTEDELAAHNIDRHRFRYINKLRLATATQRPPPAREDHLETVEEIEEGGPDTTIAIPRQRDPFDDYLTIPRHMIPAQFYQLSFPYPSHGSPTPVLAIVEVRGSESYVTILSLWNTMMGTSLLTMPWGIAQAGLIGGVVFSIMIGGSSCATAIIILYLHELEEQYRGYLIPEFAQLAMSLMYRNKAVGMVMNTCSILAVSGACTVYWMLMTDFTYKVVHFLFVDRSEGTWDLQVVCDPSNTPSGQNATDLIDLTPMDVDFGVGDSHTTFDSYWNKNLVAVYLVVVLLPLISLNNIKIFSKLNALGTISVFVLVGLVIYFASEWGINVDFSDTASVHYTPMIVYDTCFSLSGALSLGCFIHNAIITIMRNNKHQKNNVRDTCIGFSLVVFTYMAIGVIFYITFPLAKSCISDNFLNNFHRTYFVIVLEKGFMLFQLMAVFPLVMYILRTQLVQMLVDLIGMAESKYLTFVVNLSAVSFYVIATITIPSISYVIRFAGAGCGLVLIFLAPTACYFAHMKRTDNWNKRFIIFGIILVSFGIVNFVMQFVNV